MNIGYSISYVWDLLTRPHFLGAVLAILFVQYRSIILHFVYTAMNDGFIQTFFNLILNLADVIRGYYQMSREIVRNLGQNYVSYFVDETDGSNHTRYPFLQRESSQFQHGDSLNAVTRNNSHKRHSSCGPPPPLVMVRTEDGMIEPTIGDSYRSMSTKSTPESLIHEMEPLEPAFLNKNDYPPGWLIYHPVLGISCVKEADEYDEQQSFTKRSMGKSQKH